ncbi:hypothetical protein CPB84DRAFT_355578, partial [Gymnopilus junonius]
SEPSDCAGYIKGPTLLCFIVSLLLNSHQVAHFIIAPSRICRPLLVKLTRNVSSPRSCSSVTPFINDNKVSFSDADITIRSSDNVLFRLIARILKSIRVHFQVQSSTQIRRFL